MKQEISIEDLERLAAAMAAAIPELDCPDCCEVGWRYEYVEVCTERFQEEWEWACLAQTLIRYRLARRRSDAAP